MILPPFLVDTNQPGTRSRMTAGSWFFMRLIAVSDFSEKEGLAGIGRRRRGVWSIQRVLATKLLIALQERKKLFVLRA